jgi:hypothetical protein
MQANLIAIIDARIDSRRVLPRQELEWDELQMSFSGHGNIKMSNRANCQWVSIR